MSEQKTGQEDRVHSVFATLRELQIRLSPGFVDRLAARVRREPRLRGPEPERVARGLASQLANLALGLFRGPRSGRREDEE